MLTEVVLTDTSGVGLVDRETVVRGVSSAEHVSELDGDNGERLVAI